MQLSKSTLLVKYRNRVSLGIDVIVIYDKRPEVPYKQNDGQAAPSPISNYKVYQHQNINQQNNVINFNNNQINDNTSHINIIQNNPNQSKKTKKHKNIKIVDNKNKD